MELEDRKGIYSEGEEEGGKGGRGGGGGGGGRGKKGVPDKQPFPVTAKNKIYLKTLVYKPVLCLVITRTVI